MDIPARTVARDELTGLVGRIEISALLGAHGPTRHDFVVGAVLFVDLDRFKWINDSMGHHVGDEVLRIVADRLRSQVRSSDVVARFGGDEFVVVMGAISSVTETTVVAKRLIQAISEPLELDGRVLGVGASIGIAIAQDGGSVPDLLRQADTALYESKRRGRGRHVIFDQRLAAAAERRVGVEAAIRQADFDDQLELHYQPIVCLDRGTVEAFEGLARFRDAEGTAVSPMEFISLATEIGEIGRVGRHLQATLLRDLAAAHEHHPDLVLALNVSSTELEQPGLVEQLAAGCEAVGVDPRHVSVELSEDLMVRDLRVLHRTLGQLREHGFRISLDDFGTGQASLSSLREFDIDEIKIDRSFVSGIENNAFSRATCEAVLLLARAVDATVVAEGIETVAELEVLRDIGVHMGQGYIFTKPRPVEWGPFVTSPVDLDGLIAAGKHVPAAPVT